MATSIVSNNTAATFGNSPQKTGEPLDHAKLFSGKALEFDGVTDYLTSSPTFANMGDTTAFTVAMWANVDDISSNNDILTVISTEKKGKYVTNESGKITFTMYNNNSYADVIGQQTDSIVLVEGKWHRIVCTYDGSQTDAGFKIYLDGALQDSTASNQNYSANITTYVTIGRTNRPSSTVDFAGKMSDYQLWDTVWSADDVKYDYKNPETLMTSNSSVSGSQTTSNLKLWYPMNEGGASNPQSTIFDAAGTSSTTKNHATTTFYGDANLTSHLIAAQITDLADNLADNVLTFADAVTDGCDGTLGSEVISTANDRQMDDSNTWTEGDEWVVNGGSSGKAIRSSADTGNNLCTHTGTGNAVASRWYKVGYTTASIAQEDVAEAAVSFNVKFGGKNATPDSTTNGVHSRLVYTLNTDKLVLDAGPNTNITIDDVTVKLADGWVICDDVTGAATCDGLATGGTMTFVNTATGENGRIALPITATTGKKYRVKADCIDSSSQSMKLSLDTKYMTSTDVDPTFGDVITVGNTGYSNEMVCTDGTLCIFVENNVTTENEKVVFDNLTVQEVGIATGWTDVVTSDVIPQTALMNGSGKMTGDGSSYVTVTCPLIGQAAFSIGMWVKKIIGIGQTMLAGVNGSGGSYFQYNGDTGILVHSAMSTTHSTLSGSGVTDDGNWHYVIATISANNSVLYRDGVSIATDTSVVGTLAAGYTALGRYAGTATKNGTLIDEITKWNKALSATEVAELYNSGVPLDARTHSAKDNLVGYYRNNHFTTAGTWEDLSTNDNHGTVVGGTTTTFFQEGLTANLDNQGFPINITHPSNGAVNFIGTTSTNASSYIDLNKDIEIEGDYMVMLWFKGNPSNLPYIWGHSGNDYFRMADKDTFTLKSNNVTKTLELETSPNKDILTEQWHHIALTRNNGTLLMYIDNEAQSSGTLSDTATLKIRALMRRDLTSDNYGSGMIDEFFVYDNFNANTVSKNYNHGKGKHKN